MRAKKETNIKIGKKIKLLRVQNSYSQEQLSEQLGITPHHLSAIERGASGASLEILKRIMDLFGVTAEQLLFDEPQGSDRLEQIICKLKRLPSDQLEYVDSFLKIMTDMNQNIHN